MCYYGPDNVDDRGSYWATYAVYRRRRNSDIGNFSYERVSEMFRAIRTVVRYTTADIVDGEIVEGGFNCYNDSIDTGNSPLTVQAGDILGCLLYTSPSPRDATLSRMPSSA